MRKTKVQLDEFTLVGLTTKTNNKNEMNPKMAKIGNLAGLYWAKQVANNIKYRKTPGVTYSVYTEYESDEHGEYTYFIGEAVDSAKDQDVSQFSTLVIPGSYYQKFTTTPGKVPEIVISAWQEIWEMDEKDFGGNRKFLADFEVYDQRAIDPNRSVIDIYIGIK